MSLKVVDAGQQVHTGWPRPGRIGAVCCALLLHESATLAAADLLCELSAWEAVRFRALTALSWASDAPLVTVMDPVTPGLMVRQWPAA